MQCGGPHNSGTHLRPHNEVELGGGFITAGTHWTPRPYLLDSTHTPQSCVITHGQPADKVKFNGCTSTPAHLQPTCRFDLPAGRNGSVDVSKSFKAYADEAGGLVGYKGSTTMWTPNDKTPLTMDDKMNFAFCGDLSNDSGTFPVCFAQAYQFHENMWYLSSPNFQAEAKSHFSDTENKFVVTDWDKGGNFCKPGKHMVSDPGKVVICGSLGKIQGDCDHATFTVEALNKQCYPLTLDVSFSFDVENKHAKHSYSNCLVDHDGIRCPGSNLNELSMELAENPADRIRGGVATIGSVSVDPKTGDIAFSDVYVNDFVMSHYNGQCNLPGVKCGLGQEWHGVKSHTGDGTLKYTS